MYIMLLKIYCSSFSAIAVCVVARWLTFYENKDASFNNQHLLSVANDKKERETWKVQSEKNSGKYIAWHMKRT